MKQLLGSPDRVVKIQKIENTHTESLLNFLSNIAIFKYYRRIQKRDEDLLNNQFGFDVVVFQDYMIMCCDVYEKEKSAIKIEEIQAKHKFQKEFIRQLKVVLKFREMLYQRNYKNIESYLKQNKSQQLYSLLIVALTNHTKYLKTLDPVPNVYTDLLPLVQPPAFPENAS